MVFIKRALYASIKLSQQSTSVKDDMVTLSIAVETVQMQGQGAPANSPAHASVGMESLLDEARLSADARHEPVRHLVCPLPRRAPHLQALPYALTHLLKRGIMHLFWSIRKHEAVLCHKDQSSMSFPMQVMLGL